MTSANAAALVRDPDAVAAGLQRRDLLRRPWRHYASRAPAARPAAQRGRQGPRSRRTRFSSRGLPVPPGHAVLERRLRVMPDTRASTAACRSRRGEQPRPERMPLELGQLDSLGGSNFSSRRHLPTRVVVAIEIVTRVTDRPGLPVALGAGRRQAPGTTPACKAHRAERDAVVPTVRSTSYGADTMRRRRGRGSPHGPGLVDDPRNVHVRGRRPSRHADQRRGSAHADARPRRSRGSAAATSRSAGSTSCRRSTASSRASGRSTGSRPRRDRPQPAVERSRRPRQARDGADALSPPASRTRAPSTSHRGCRCPSSSRRSSSSRASAHGARTSSAATTPRLERRSPRSQTSRGSTRPGRSRRSSSPPRGYDCGIVVAGGQSSAQCAASRRPASGGRTSHSAPAESRSTRRTTRAAIALAAAAAVGGDLVGVDLLPRTSARGSCSR